MPKQCPFEVIQDSFYKRNLDQRTRKLKTIHKALHLKGDVCRLYAKKVR